MRVTERHGDRDEQTFVEGEPELQPPEELAVADLDDDVLLEEDLECELVLEQDVEEEVLEVTLEDLVHAGDDEPEPDPDLAPDEFRCRSCLQVRHRSELSDSSGPVCRHCSS